MMLQKINHKDFYRSTNRYNNHTPEPPKTASLRHHILNIDFQDCKPHHSLDLHMTIEPMIKTHMNAGNLSWRAHHVKRSHHNGRKTANFDRQCINDSHFGTVKITQKHEVVPFIDQQHYQYLMKAVFGLKKGKKLSQLKFMYLQSSEQRGKSCSNNGKRQNQHKIRQNMSKSVNQEHKQKIHQPALTSSPKIVNISAELNSKRQDKANRDLKDNLYEKLFKNKRKLHDRYFAGRNSGEPLDISILGEQQLQIHQIPWIKKYSRHQNHS